MVISQPWISVYSYYKFQSVSPFVFVACVTHFVLKGAYKNCQNSFLSQLKKSTIV